MSAKNKAKQASLNNTEARIEKVIARSEDQNNIVLPTTFEGVDSDTGRDKFKAPDQCAGDAVALGKVITTGQLRVGEVVLARTTEGDRRLDKRTSFSRSSDCGDGGTPGQRGYANIVQANNEAEAPESEFEDSDTPPDCPQGSIKTDSVQFIGKAKVYERYTGSYTQNSDGTYTCDTEEVSEPNAVPDSELADTDTGCVSPLEESGAQPLKRCQWFDATEEEALNYTGCPDGMFNSGFTEFPEGSYKILCCTADDSPAPEQGIGAEWGTANVIEKGTAAESTGYCSGTASGGLAWSNGNIETEKPPISYELTPATPDQWDYVFSGTGASGGCVDKYSVIYRESVDVTPLIALDFRSGAPITSCPLPISDVRAKVSFDGGTTYKTVLQNGNTPPVSTFYPSGRVIDWQGTTVANSLPTLFSKTFIAGTPWVLKISDSTGIIATYEYETEPTNFQYYCRSSDRIC